jgi:hypothetical protein
MPLKHRHASLRTRALGVKAMGEQEEEREESPMEKTMRYDRGKINNTGNRHARNPPSPWLCLEVVIRP